MTIDPIPDPVSDSDPLAHQLRAAFEQVRQTVVQTGRLVGRLGARLDAISLDLARDVGEVARDARALAESAREQATAIKRATPRAARLAQVAAAILARHRWLRLQAAARHGRVGGPAAAGLSADDHRDLARRVTAAAAELRGGIAKLGQIASCRPDLIGPIWATELATLQDDVPPVEASAIRARIEAELGAPVDQLFATFDDAPIAAASLAQVHAATLDDGTRVVVKVQVPGIEGVIEADIAALRVIAGALGDVPGLDLPTLVAELGRALAVELDYEAEAEAMWSFATSAVVPVLVESRSTRRVLTMTRIEGERLIPALDRLGASDPDARDAVFATLVSEIAAQVLVRGRVHADPHPGNFLVTSDGRLAILDFGCMLTLDKSERAAYARLVLAIAGGDRAAVVRELATLGFTADDPHQLAELATSMVGAMRPDTAVSEIDWQVAFADQIAAARGLGGLSIPRSFVLLGRVLATVAGLLATYKPRIQLHPLIASSLAQAIA